MAKLKRERAVKEKRALKLEKKEARKQAALDALNGTAPEVEAPPAQLEDESPPTNVPVWLDPQNDRAGAKTEAP
jgi:hypothetical protein